MMNRISRPLLRTHNTIHSIHSVRVRGLSSASGNNSSFPASLLRYNAREKFSLFDRNKREGKEDEPRQNAIEISENGLVVLGAPAEPLKVYRGAMMMPNTFTMQEIVRMLTDYYIENEEAGKQVDIPFIYSIKKGTPIPSNLVLFQTDESTFRLQPSQPMSVEDLNTSLDEFFVPDDAVTVWVEK